MVGLHKKALGKATDPGEYFDKLRDKFIIAFIFINMYWSLLALTTKLAHGSTLYYVAVSSAALSILAISLDVFLFIIGTFAIAYNYFTNIGATNRPKRWGKLKMRFASPGFSVYFLYLPFSFRFLMI